MGRCFKLAYRPTANAIAKIALAAAIIAIAISIAGWFFNYGWFFN